MGNWNIDLSIYLFTFTIMNLYDLSKLPKDQVRIIDRTKQEGWPLKWYNTVTIIHGGKSHTVRRYTAFNHGLCAGVNGEMPPVYQRGGVKEGRGRKPLRPEERKVQISVWPLQQTVDLLGGKERVRKMLINFLNQRR